MGDRVTTSLTVLKEHEQQAIELIKPEEGEPDDLSEDGKTVCLTYYEVNYGTIESLIKLKNAGIPYDFSWGDGCEFTEGEESVRFTPEGEVKITTQSKLWPREVILECLTAMKGALSGEAAEAALHAKLATITPLPWDHQADYGRLYCTRQLIAPSSV